MIFVVIGKLCKYEVTNRKKAEFLLILENEQLDYDMLQYNPCQSWRRAPYDAVNVQR